MEKNTALKELTDHHAAMEMARARETAAVVLAKEAGASWAEVAAVLGMTRQAAQQKYGAIISTPARTTNRDTSRDHLYTAAENADADLVVSIFSDAAAPAKPAKASKIVDAAAPASNVITSVIVSKLHPQATKAHQTKQELDDKTGPLDTSWENPSGWGINQWQQDNPKHFAIPLHERRFGPCTYCGQKHHKSNGGTWIYPGCKPTLNDPVYTATEV